MSNQVHEVQSIGDLDSMYLAHTEIALFPSMLSFFLSPVKFRTYFLQVQVLKSTLLKMIEIKPKSSPLPSYRFQTSPTEDCRFLQRGTYIGEQKTFDP